MPPKFTGKILGDVDLSKIHDSFWAYYYRRLLNGQPMTTIRRASTIAWARERGLIKKEDQSRVE